MKTNFQLRILSLVVIAYMLLAFSWWSVLLYTKNRDAFQAKAELLKIGMVAEGLVQSEADFLGSDRYETLRRQYRRQEWMILGEAGVFVVSLVIGMWLINRAYHREIFTARQQRNFLLSITHELKSPIASIRLVLDTLQKRKPPPAQTAKLAATGLQETERLHGLVNDLLLSARLETAYQSEREPVNLRELFQDVIERLQAKYPEAEFEFEEPVPLEEFPADRPGLSSVAFNLLENAVKYSARPAHVRVSLCRDEQNLFIRVADRGHGVPEKEKQQIFEKFYRVGNEDTRKTKGTGLGLYIVQQIVQAHRGQIEVKDNEPQGTVFEIRFPLAPTG